MSLSSGAISGRGLTLSIFGRIVRNRGSDAMLRVALALVSMVVMFYPDDTLALSTAVVLLPAVIYGTYRHRMVAAPRAGCSKTCVSCYISICFPLIGQVSIQISESECIISTRNEQSLIEPLAEQ